MSNTPEGKIKNLVNVWIKKRGIYMVSIIPSAFGGSTGVSDKIGILPNGTFLAIEVKAEGKKKNVSKLQQQFIDKINSNNGIAVVVSCQADLEYLDDILTSKGLLV